MVRHPHRRSMLGLVALGLATYVLAGGATPAGATFPGNPGPITFVGSHGIYVAKKAGANGERIVKGTGVLGDPAFSAGARRIVYDRSLGHNNTEIFVMRANGSHNQRLTNNHALDVTPAFSPNGKRIVFARFVESTFAYQLFEMRANGTHVRRLTNEDKRDINPEFSPNGKKIVFDRNLHIAQISAAGSHERVLRLRGAPPFAFSPDFSPSGKRIVFAGDLTDTSSDEVFIAPSAGGKVKQLTHNRVNDDDPVFSPKGGRIGFSVASAHIARLDVMRPDGTHRKHLLGKHPGIQAEPDWGAR